MTTATKACPRCGGFVKGGMDAQVYTEQCLMCGYVKYSEIQRKRFDAFCGNVVMIPNSGKDEGYKKFTIRAVFPPTPEWADKNAVSRHDAYVNLNCPRCGERMKYGGATRSDNRSVFREVCSNNHVIFIAKDFTSWRFPSKRTEIVGGGRPPKTKQSKKTMLRYIGKNIRFRDKKIMIESFAEGGGTFMECHICGQDVGMLVDRKRDRPPYWVEYKCASGHVTRYYGSKMGSGFKSWEEGRKA